MADKWEIKSADDVAQALDWLRRRMNGAGLVLVAIGKNSVAFAMDPQLAAKDAVALLEAQIEGGALERGLADLKQRRRLPDGSMGTVTRGHAQRDDV
jgi:hypothetical protein